MQPLLIAARLLLALVFAVAGLAKLGDVEGSRDAMRSFGLPASIASVFGLLLPIAELALSAALLPGATAWWAAVGALALLLVFISAISYNLAVGRTPDCHCFGQFHSAPVGWPTLVRNGLLAAVAAAIVWQGPRGAGPGLLNWVGVPSAMQAIALASGVVVIGFGALLTRLLLDALRQNGRLLLRVEALEARLGVDNSTRPPIGAAAGLATGATAPRFVLPTLGGATMGLDDLLARGKPIVLVFSDAGCGPCAAMLPDVARRQQDLRGALTIAIVSRGTAAANEAKTAGLGLQDVFLQSNREVFGAYGVKATPSAVYVRTNGTVASALALGPGAIGELIDRAADIAGVRTEPLREKDEPDDSDDSGPLPIGVLAPDFTRPGLDGLPRSLADFRGRATLLVFWDPECGFCQSMLSDLQTWIASHPDAAQDMLIVSIGSATDTLAMGLRAPTVLDTDFGVGKIFGASGTPMAVLIDAEGRVASPVRAGAPAVFALARTLDRRALLPA